MIVLGLDTATYATSVALCELEGDAAGAPAPQRALELRDDPPPGGRPGHARASLALAERALERAGCRWEQIGRIAVGVGPGTFTGLRVGIATAHGLALALGIELVGVSSLRALALGAQEAAGEHGAELICAVLDARRGEVFAACWRAVGVAEEPPLAPPTALAPGRLAEQLARERRTVLAVGDGAAACRDALTRAGALVPAEGSALHRVCAVAHCRLSGGSSSGIVLPDYVRRPDAEPARGAGLSRAIQPVG